jgi:hypothetical protein
MANLEKIWINDFGGRNEIRIDWDNDRHQAIFLSDLHPDSVKRSLLDAIRSIDRDQRDGYL